MKRKVLKLIIAAFAIGLIIGLNVRIHNQNKEIDQLTGRLHDTQVQLIISDDQLKQIRMNQEFEYYMGSDSE